MGQALSVQSGPGAEDLVFALHQGGPLPELSAISLPLALNNPRKTTVHALGSIQPEIVLWHVAGGRKVWPFPIGYRASCEAYGTQAVLDIKNNHQGHTCFVVKPQRPGDQLHLSSHAITTTSPAPIMADTTPLEAAAAARNSPTGGGDPVDTSGHHDVNNVIYVGSSPTAAFAKWALAVGRVEVMNGMDAFGFLDSRVQAALRQLGSETGEQDTYVRQAEPGGAVSTYVQDWVTSLRQGHAATAPLRLDQILPPMPLSALHPQRQQQQQQEQQIPVSVFAQTLLQPPPPQQEQPRERAAPSAGLSRGVAVSGSAQRVPSVTPSLHTWLELTAPQQAQQQGRQLGEESMETPITGTPIAAGLVLPPLPGSNPLLTRQWSTPFRPSEPDLRAFHATHAGIPQQPQQQQQQQLPFLSTRSASRTTTSHRPSSSEGPQRSGRGWTAFTAYGIEQRDLVRAQYPTATAPEIEKMVGQKWAGLSKEEKHQYACFAAQVRKSSLGGEGSEAAGLKRTRSDAATLEVRQVRRRRRPPFKYGLEYETEECQEPEIKIEEEQGGTVPFPAAGLPLRAPRPTKGLAAPRRRKKVKGASLQTGTAAAAVAKAPVPAHRPEALAEDEQDVLGLLAVMRAEAIASESDDAAGGGAEPAGMAGVHKSESGIKNMESTQKGEDQQQQRSKDPSEKSTRGSVEGAAAGGSAVQGGGPRQAQGQGQQEQHNGQSVAVGAEKKEKKEEKGQQKHQIGNNNYRIRFEGDVDFDEEEEEEEVIEVVGDSQ